MKHERGFSVGTPVSSAIEPYPGWVRSLVYLSAATFGIAFWSALLLFIFR